MNYIQTEIDGVWLIEPKVFFDERGYFMEAFKKEEFESHIGPVNFVQDNESKQYLYFLPLPHGHGSLRPTFLPT